ncbi:MAG: HemK/PrmC family methyltransferase [Patescibacteria group bacterium]
MTAIPPKRTLTPYEQTQLRRYGRADLITAELDETPVEYLTGKVEFCDLVLNVSPDVLIPRVETEGLVARATELCLSRSYTKIAEIGTGCGAIALGLAQTLAQSQYAATIIASELSQSALNVARTNLEEYPSLKTYVSLQQGDLLDRYQNQSLELIVANLPYIPETILDSLDTSVRLFEPELALNGGAEGFELIAALLDQAPQKLLPGSSVLLEMDYTHNLAMLKPWEQLFEISLFPDYREVRRFAQLDLR